jgi:hypothetical protein
MTWRVEIILDPTGTRIILWTKRERGTRCYEISLKYRNSGSVIVRSRRVVDWGVDSWCLNVGSRILISGRRFIFCKENRLVM